MPGRTSSGVGSTEAHEKSADQHGNRAAHGEQCAPAEQRRRRERRRVVRKQSRRDKRAHEHSQHERDVPRARALPIVVEKAAALRQNASADRAQAGRRSEWLVPHQEKQGNKKPDERAGDVPGPGLGEPFPHRAPPLRLSSKRIATRSPDMMVIIPTVPIATGTPKKSATTPASSAPATYPRSRQSRYTPTATPRHEGRAMSPTAASSVGYTSAV